MEVVAVSRVVVGRERGREQAAGAVADVAQESRLRAVAAPVAGDRDPAAVLEPEAGDVDGVGQGMLAPAAALPAVEAAAAIASEMVDRGDPGAEMLERGGLDDVPFPQSEAGGDGAGGAEVGRAPGGGKRSAGTEADRLVIAAALAGPAGRERGEADPGAPEQDTAESGLVVERGELAAGEDADRPAEIELGPGHVLRVPAGMAVEQEAD